MLGKMKSRRLGEREGEEETKTCSLRAAVASSQNPHQTQIACPVLHHEAGQDKKGTAHKKTKLQDSKDKNKSNERQKSKFWDTDAGVSSPVWLVLTLMVA